MGTISPRWPLRQICTVVQQTPGGMESRRSQFIGTGLLTMRYLADTQLVKVILD